MKKRGLSPVVATLLLIAIVVVISIIVFTWVKSIGGEYITKFNGNNQENVQLVCNDVQFDAQYVTNTITITNTGNVPIYQMKAKLEGSGSHHTITLSDSWPKTGLNPGDVYTGSLSLSGATKLTLIPVLVGQASSGRKTYTCSDSQGKEIAI